MASDLEPDAGAQPRSGGAKPAKRAPRQARDSLTARLGASGERFVVGWLEARGLRIVGRNWRCAVGELDIIGEQGDEIVFVEVKTRRGERMGSGEEAVTVTKRRRLIAAAQTYLAERNAEQRPFRIDVVAVALAPSGALLEVRHVPYAVEEE